MKNRGYYASVQSIIERLDSMIERFQEQIDGRVETFYEHSESWQESEKGQEFLSITDQMQGDIDLMQFAVDYLTDIEEEYD